VWVDVSAASEKKLMIAQTTIAKRLTSMVAVPRAARRNNRHSDMARAAVKLGKQLHLKLQRTWGNPQSSLFLKNR